MSEKIIRRLKIENFKSTDALDFDISLCAARANIHFQNIQL